MSSWFSKVKRITNKISEQETKVNKLRKTLPIHTNYMYFKQFNLVHICSATGIQIYFANLTLQTYY